MLSVLGNNIYRRQFAAQAIALLGIGLATVALTEDGTFISANGRLI